MCKLSLPNTPCSIISVHLNFIKTLRIILKIKSQYRKIAIHPNVMHILLLPLKH